MAPKLPYNFPKRKTGYKDIWMVSSLIHFQSVSSFILIIVLFGLKFSSKEWTKNYIFLPFLLISPFQPQNEKGFSAFLKHSWVISYRTWRSTEYKPCFFLIRSILYSYYQMKYRIRKWCSNTQQRLDRVCILKYFRLSSGLFWFTQPILTTFYNIFVFKAWL